MNGARSRRPGTISSRSTRSRTSRTFSLRWCSRRLQGPDNSCSGGDSNQIVHPNFFSWSSVKSLFWRDEAIASRQELNVLRANFRNGRDATRVANLLLKIKHRRFGSIDRESNFLVDAVGGDEGAVALLPDESGVKAELNRNTKASTRFAVLVLRDEDKAAARAHFQTPLIFAIHEAKGLEYDNIVLYRFVSDNRARFAEIASSSARRSPASISWRTSRRASRICCSNATVMASTTGRR